MSPIETLLVAAVSTLAGVIVWLYKSQETARANAHKETRAQMAALEGRIAESEKHVEECDKDRENLRTRVAVLEDREERKVQCPKTDCPLRLP
ncbi:hypothetical protein JIN85_19355 [Luteolibacter pohnpeiensis]|uniref:Uncharacterized protein n=1 Tax=Luteolibacter pohnpeiensis TaxID=454153 RepID=A0A934S9F9_9BACT|nr:hypothetical protein [Luteolibacter pohnpeiensis]MBK1884582.1 hypothetical protein [Luteolibacter pohnpeiensis]